MAHAQKPDFRLSAKRTNPFKSAGASVQSTTGSRGMRISGSNAGYTKFRGSVKSTGYLLHSLDSPSLPLHFPSRASLCAITFQLDSNRRTRSPTTPPPAFSVQLAEPQQTCILYFVTACYTCVLEARSTYCNGDCISLTICWLATVFK